MNQINTRSRSLIMAQFSVNNMPQEVVTVAAGRVNHPTKDVVGAAKKISLQALKTTLAELLKPVANDLNAREKIINTLHYALKAIQEGLNHYGQYLLPEGRDLDQALLETILAGSHPLSDLKAHLECICMHRNAPRGDRKYSFTGGTNYTNSAEIFRGLMVAEREIIAVARRRQRRSVVPYLGLSEIRNLGPEVAGISSNTRLKPIGLAIKQPKVLANIDKISEIRCGDLHGNFHKLLDHFIRAGVITLSPENYRQLVTVSAQSEQSHGNNCCQIFKDLVANGQISITPNKVNIILIGDIFADRNPSDRAKIDLLTHLSESGVKFNVTWSNHDEMFLNHLLEKAAYAAPLRESFVATEPAIRDEYMDKFQKLVMKHYQLLNYADGILTSHAPMHLRMFEQLCQDVNVAAELDLAGQIEALNLKFQELMHAAITSGDTTELWRHFHNAVWIRKSQYVVALEDAGNWLAADKPLTTLAGVMGHVSGHDIYAPVISADNHLISLDNQLGKVPGHQASEQILITYMEAAALSDLLSTFVSETAEVLKPLTN